MTINLIRMSAGYRECAEWADCGPDHDTHGREFSTELEERMMLDCRAFVLACGEPLLDALAEYAPGYSDERFGHDFWLTRNGHGAGYWDRKELDVFPDDALQTLGDMLADRAKSAGTCDLYVGDDGLVYA